MPESPLHATVCAWLEAAGWSFARGERALAARELGGGELVWVAVAQRESSPLILTEPAAGPQRLVLSHYFRLEPAERERRDRLGVAERTQLAWDLLTHLNLLQVEYLLDGPVPDEVMLSLSVPSDGLTRTLFLDRVDRLAAALRLVSLAYAKALGRLLERPPAPVVH
ncbi:MAG TPA: hypothetical protein VF121_16185 [Thermoanaerobaculia bacterium]|nr:hypothetical protein [Thermoanaerobaculia bacterium]